MRSGAFWLVTVEIITASVKWWVVWSEWATSLLCAQACSHHLLCNIPTTLTERLQVRLGSLLADFSTAEPSGDGGCTNSTTPAAPFSLQLVCICMCVRVCAAAVRTAVYSNMLHLCTQPKMSSDGALSKSVSHLCEPGHILAGAPYGNTVILNMRRKRMWFERLI